jgi:cell division protein FtsB
MDFSEKAANLLQRYGRAALGLLVLLLLVHNVFGAHGFLAMHQTRAEIEKVQQNIDRLNKENEQLADQVHALKTDPHAIEKIARDELNLARPGDVIIKIPQQQPSPSRPRKP